VRRILLAEKSSFSEVGRRALSEIAPTDSLDLTQDQLSRSIKGYQVLVVRLGLQVDETVLSVADQLQVVATPTTGLDHIDLQAAADRGVGVLSLKGERAFLEQVYATAEHTMALLLSLVRRVPAAFDAVKGYEWRRDLYRGTELSGKVLGIVGYGRLGEMVARCAGGFGMAVLVFDPYRDDLPSVVRSSPSLSHLLTHSDVVSIHVPLNAETTGMISSEQLTSMRPGAVLVNTARGRVVDEAALLAALESGQLAGAALDVLCDEHQIEAGVPHPLIEYARSNDNLILTPHIAGATYESVEKADLFIANKIKEFFKNQ